MVYKGKLVYGKKESEIKNALEAKLDTKDVVSLDVDLHNHGPWTDYHQGFLNLEFFPRYVGHLARTIKNKGLDICGLVDVQSENLSEKRFETLLRSADKTGRYYDFEFDERTATMFFEIDGKRVAIPRVQEVVTNKGLKHFLAVDLPFDVNIPGGMSPQDTVRFIKDMGGYVIADHPYLGFRGKRIIEMCRGDIDFLEYNGLLNSRAKIFPWLALSGAVALYYFGQEISLASASALVGLVSFVKPFEISNHLVEKRAPILDLQLIGSSDAHKEKDIGKTRTRIYMSKQEAEEKENLTRNMLLSVQKGNHQIYSETESISSFFSHTALIGYSIFRSKIDWLDNFSDEERRFAN